MTSNDRLCPKCGTNLEPYAEVDIGVGTMYGGPWGCPACHWTEKDEAAEEIKRLEREEIERPLREEIARLRALLTEVHNCGAGAHMLQRIAEALAGSPAETEAEQWECTVCSRKNAAAEKLTRELELRKYASRQADARRAERDRLRAITDGCPVCSELVRNTVGAHETGAKLMTDAQIKHMVDRFLGWRLPENFQPDAGISFDPVFNVEYNAAFGYPPQRRNPIGTNLFDAAQAEAMVRYMVEEMPSSETGGER